ncbi:3-oxoacyl-[acyl-carrier-protein] synthase 2 [mine drainage metagenome]|uniref:Nodulation protein E n=1 Tax=mine drainage metagenome TaxID=410659 RepID=A0A1J5RU10_9ZZZZ
MTRRVFVTGVGILAPGGADAGAFFSSLIAGRSSIGPLQSPFAEKLTTRIAASVDFDPKPHFPAMRAAMLDRYAQFALVAARQAVADAALVFDDETRDRAGVFWGTGMGGAQTIEQGYNDVYLQGQDRVRPLSVPMSMNNAATAQIGIEYGIRGPALTYSTACASSANAIGEAFRAIRHGEIDLAVAGGSEALLTFGALKAWEGLRALALEDPVDPATSCRPFSADRSGLVLGEGAGALILESEEHARARGASLLAQLAGYGRSNDAAHLTKPAVHGQVRAMRQALLEAGLPPAAIGYLNAHGTATPVGDQVETAAIKEVFGEAAARLPVSSTKSMHGHLMGAAGAVELIAALMAMRSGSIPPTANYRRPDPECDLDYVPNVARHGVAIDAVMSNSFAFGGGNAVLVLRRSALPHMPG